MKRILMITAFGATLLGVTGFTATPAAAGCDPKCAAGEKCRYEAAGGKFYCEPEGGIKAGGMTVVPGASGGSGPARGFRGTGKTWPQW